MWGTVQVTSGLIALGRGTHRTGHYLGELLWGLFVLGFFVGLARLSTHLMWQPQRLLSPEVAALIAPPRDGKNAKKVWLTLADGRTVPATVGYARHLLRKPRGVDAREVVAARDR